MEYVGCADAEGKGVTAAMVANAKANAEHERDAKPSEIQVSRKQLKALQKDGLLSKTKTGNSDLFSFRGG